MIIAASADPKWYPQVLEFKKEAADNEEKLEFYCHMSQDPRSPNLCPLSQGVGWELARQKNHRVTKKIVNWGNKIGSMEHFARIRQGPAEVPPGFASVASSLR